MKPTPWTTADLSTLRRLSAAGYSDPEIARALGKHRRCVQRKRRELGIDTTYTRAHVAVLARLALRRLQNAA